MKKKKREFDPLFIATHDWQFNVCLDMMSPDPLESYTMGYKEAADRLVTARYVHYILGASGVKSSLMTSYSFKPALKMSIMKI